MTTQTHTGPIGGALRRAGLASAALAGLAVMAVSCVTPAKISVFNRCGETIQFAHFEQDTIDPEFWDEMLAELDWVTLEPGDNTTVEVDAGPDSTATFTVVAEDDPRVWDPVTANVQREDPDDWHSGYVHIIGDLCTPPAG